MKSTRKLARAHLSAITDEKGDLKAPRESFRPSSQGTPPQISQLEDILTQHLFIPVNIYESHDPPRTTLRLGLMERIGLLTVRMFGVDSMTLWLPLFVILALLGVILVIGRW